MLGPRRTAAAHAILSKFASQLSHVVGGHGRACGGSGVVGRRRRCLNAVLARAHAFLSGTGPSLGFEVGVWGFAFLEFQGNSGCLTFLECFNHKLTGTAPMVPCTCVVDVPCLSKDLLSFSVMDLWLATDTCLVHHLLGCQKATNTHHRTTTGPNFVKSSTLTITELTLILIGFQDTVSKLRTSAQPVMHQLLCQLQIITSQVNVSVARQRLWVRV